MSQALNNLKKLIIEMVEEELSLEERLNLFLEKMFQPILPNGLITNHKQRKSLMFTHQLMLMLGQQKNTKPLVVVGKKNKSVKPQ